MKEKIQIGIPCGPNSEMYVSFLISSIEATISKDFDYEYILGVNQKGVNFQKFQNIKNLKVVEEYLGLPHVKGHGQCLDLILRHMNAKYGMFVDSDVAFLKKSWDKLLVEKINDKCIMIGSEYHPTDGKIVNFPNVITCLFDVEKVKNLNLTFVPKLKHIQADDTNARWYGVQPGDQLYLDTGCHIPEDFGRAGFEWATMKIVTPRYPDRIPMMKFMKEGGRGEEYQLDGVPICTHIGRSLSRNFSRDTVITNWLKSVKEWFDGQV